jgi:hypothetical protein
MRALGSRPPRDRGEKTSVRRTIIGFIITCALGGLGVALRAPEAQPPTHVHRIGALSGQSTAPGRGPFVEAFLEGMRALGYVEDQHFVLEYRAAAGQYKWLPWNPANPGHALMVREADVAAQTLGVQLHLVEARGLEAFDSAFAAMTRVPAGALLVLGDAMFLQHRSRLAELAAMRHLPAMYAARLFVEAGGLLGYGANLMDQWRCAATYVDKILKGAKPADLPVEQPTKFEVVINLKTAEALGITIPPTLLFQVDGVIK